MVRRCLKGLPKKAEVSPLDAKLDLFLSQMCCLPSFLLRF